MSIIITIANSPGIDFHFDRLGLDPNLEIILHSNSNILSNVEFPFRNTSSASVFHVHEVMRMVLYSIPVDNDGLVHTNSAASKFRKLSYHADEVWKKWREGVENAGDDVAIILQQIFGIRLRPKGRWIPQQEHRFICVEDSDWAIIDDVLPSSIYFEKFGMDNLWFSMETGLRLIRKSVITEDYNQTTFGELMGQQSRFPSASSWLQWCLRQGKEEQLPASGQGTVVYFKGIINQDIPRYYPSNREGPDENWWGFGVPDDSVPRFSCDGDLWCFGVRFEHDEENGWSQNYPHLRSDEGKIIKIDRESLNIQVSLPNQNQEEDIFDTTDPLHVWRSINRHLLITHLRAIRVLLIEAGLAINPDKSDNRIGGLGLSGGAIETPYSELYFLRPRGTKGKNYGIVLGSPIEVAVRGKILSMNWYGA